MKKLTITLLTLLLSFALLACGEKETEPKPTKRPAATSSADVTKTPDSENDEQSSKGKVYSDPNDFWYGEYKRYDGTKYYICGGLAPHARTEVRDMGSENTVEIRLPEKDPDGKAVEGFLWTNGFRSMLNKTILGDNAAYVSKIVLPNNYKIIAGDNSTSADEKIKKILSVELNEGLEIIDNNAFSGWCAISEIKIPSTVTHIGNCAFNYTDSLTSIVLPDGIDTINSSAFRSSGITSINFPASLKTIGNWAFEECKIKEAILPAGIERIGKEAFKKTEITSITIPGSVKNLEALFELEDKLNEMIIEEGVQEISECALVGKKIHVPSSANVFYSQHFSEGTSIYMKKGSPVEEQYLYAVEQEKKEGHDYTNWHTVTVEYVD